MTTVKDLCGPDPRPMSCAEVDEIQRLIRLTGNVKPVVVQIGADIGVSTCAIVTVCRNAHVFSVDRGICEAEFENLNRCGLGNNNVVRMYGDSSLIGTRWPDVYKIDLLFIDGDHSENGVRKDINAWVPHVREEYGIIAFHDYIPEPIPPHIKGRVIYAVDDLMKDYKKINRVERLISFWNRRDYDK